MSTPLESLIIRKSHRVPAPVGPAGDGASAARQLDAVLMSAGYKLSADLLTQLGRLDAGVVIDTGIHVLDVVRREIGDHVQHNVYFKDFPANVPDTVEFWAGLLAEALLDPAVIARGGITTLTTGGGLNLLDLPSYGRYLHTYEEMVAAHDTLIPGAGDRVTVLHAGGALEQEATALYLRLASATTPPSDDDIYALALLARYCADGPQPSAIPVRETRAIINRGRLELNRPILADTVTDVLRLACALSDGDVSLQEPTRFTPFPRRVRRALLAVLDTVIGASPAKLADVNAHREQWKRLGERLHPHEYPHWPHAADVFAVARGDKIARTLTGRAELAFAAGDVPAAATVLANAPGLLLRSLDRLLRAAAPTDQFTIAGALDGAIRQASGRVLLSVREHLHNRTRPAPGPRVFANRRGTAWTTPDVRPPLDSAAVVPLIEALDAEVGRRLPAFGRIVVDPAVLGVALPLSGKSTPSGFGVLPRGSITPVDGDLLRFFIYWRQAAERTDFDLSALMTDREGSRSDHASWTSLAGVGYEHSGDITSAPDGATEFINLHLAKMTWPVVIPQVLVYSGEGFDDVAESFFGYMCRDHEQAGRPFEPATVRVKSDLRGPGRIALPVAFTQTNGQWAAKWLHLTTRGTPNFATVEGTKVTTSMLVRAILARDYLTIGYLIGLLAPSAESVVSYTGQAFDGPVTYIGLTEPDGLPDGSTVFTLNNLQALLPA